MKKLNITGIILFIVIFCSCGKSQKEINREKDMRFIDSKPWANPSAITKAAIVQYKYIDSVVRQDISYDYKNHKYLLTTISVANFPQGLKETAELQALRNNAKVCYDRTISGSFNYIKSNKAAQLNLAKKYLANHYVRLIKNQAKDKLIQDSIQILISEK